jgi:ATPases involved in chromosome partitioning
MKQEPLFVAFSTQKGGVGKTTFTVLAASYLHYQKGYNVAVVDCDYPQYSVNRMRKRDIATVEKDEVYHRMLFEQLKRTNKKPYPVFCSTPENAIKEINEYLEQSDTSIDVVFFDLPGTVQSDGVMQTIANMDFIFTPITADRLVLESNVSFAVSLHEILVTNPAMNLKGIYLFWNMIDGREKTDLYECYEKSIHELGLTIMKTFIPDTKRYRKELAQEGKPPFRSTLFPVNKKMAAGSNFEELLSEIFQIIKG